MVLTMVYRQNMETIAISKFKATCLAVQERVRRTGEPILVTRFGEPVVEIQPPPAPSRPRRWLGSLRERGEIVTEIVSPAIPAEEVGGLEAMRLLLGTHI